MKTFASLVHQHFKIPEASVTDALTAKDIPEWDSMNYLLFIADLEKEYNVSFTMDEVLSADSLGTVRRLLVSKGAQV
jgi:acyl carrier protein